MAYTAPEDAQRPRAVYAINPNIRGIFEVHSLILSPTFEVHSLILFLRRFSSRIFRL